MTIQEVANELNKCASGLYCDKCKYNQEQNIVKCQNYLVLAMGAEVKKIAEQMCDDGK